MNMMEFIRYANYMLLGAVNAMKQEVRAGHKVEEPDYLTAIVTKFPLLMNGTWRKVKFGGCFIHKSPQVTFKKGGRCEVGDLMVICRKKIGGEIRYNAVLFQLKIPDYHFFEVKQPNELVQYELYTKWPEFSIGGKYYPALTRNIEPKTVTSGAQYMFINDPCDEVRGYWDYECYYHFPCVFTHSIPELEMESSVDLSFGRFLWDFFHWQNGRAITPQEKCNEDEWSHFIWDLIEKTRQAVIRNINVGITKTSSISKQQGDFFHFLTTNECISYLPQSYSDWRERGNDGEKEYSQKEIDEDENGAISTLFIDMIEMD